MASPSTSTCIKVNNQQEFIAHAVLLGYDNRGIGSASSKKVAYTLAPPNLVRIDLPLMSVGPDSVLFLSTPMAGSIYSLQEAFEFIWSAMHTVEPDS